MIPRLKELYFKEIQPNLKVQLNQPPPQDFQWGVHRYRKGDTYL